MKFDVRILPSNRMRADADLILLAERLGFAAAWVAEHTHNPFFSLTIAAKETSAIQLGTHDAVAFPRSPMVSAQIAWDLARQSSGRFRLGLHAQADSPDESGEGARRVREYIESLRAIWHTFQTDERLRYRGEYYTFRLMAPFFNPGPIEDPDIPIYLGSMKPEICELAGRLCQGLHASPFHTADYLSNVVKPAVSEGMLVAGRDENDFSLAVPVLIASAVDDADMRRARQNLKRRIARAANTESFRRVLAHHHWDFSTGGRGQPTRESHQETLEQSIPDDVVSEIAIVAPPRDVLRRIMERYAGLADCVSLHLNSENSPLIEAILTGS